VRLRAPREAIRLRAPPPPDYAWPDDGAAPEADHTPGDALEGEPIPTSPAETLEQFDQALACARDDAALQEITEQFASRLAALSREEAALAERIRVRHGERVAGLAGRPA
jgi:hypothetical protein